MIFGYDINTLLIFGGVIVLAIAVCLVLSMLDSKPAPKKPAPKVEKPIAKDEKIAVNLAPAPAPIKENTQYNTEVESKWRDSREQAKEYVSTVKTYENDDEMNKSQNYNSAENRQRHRIMDYHQKRWGLVERDDAIIESMLENNTATLPAENTDELDLSPEELRKLLGP